jgi:hypothetical protein
LISLSIGADLWQLLSHWSISDSKKPTALPPSEKLFGKVGSNRGEFLFVQSYKVALPIGTFFRTCLGRKTLSDLFAIGIHGIHPFFENMDAILTMR